MTGKIITALTKKEADTHWSRGRLEEAMGIYTKLLASSPDMTLNTRVAIESRIQLLRKEVERNDSEGSGRDVETAIKKLQEAMGADQTMVDLQEKAKQFYQKGLYADALECLKQMIRQHAANEFCVDVASTCLANLHPVEDLPVAVDLFLVESFQNAEKATQFKFLLAEKMDKNGHHGHAKVLHRHQDRFTSSTF